MAVEIHPEGRAKGTQRADQVVEESFELGYLVLAKQPSAMMWLSSISILWK